jgi:hypothetical protein
VAHARARNGASGLRHAGGGVVLDELLADGEAEDRLHNRHGLHHHCDADAGALELGAEPGESLWGELAHAVIAEAGSDVQ